MSQPAEPESSRRARGMPVPSEPQGDQQSLAGMQSAPLTRNATVKVNPEKSLKQPVECCAGHAEASRRGFESYPPHSLALLFRCRDSLDVQRIGLA